ncbi:MAG: helix-turn-helix transcriptional regulator [Anaerolineales bacterium]
MQLTRRQLQVAHMMADGLTREDVAEQLDISPNTVLAHMHNLYQRTGADDYDEAIELALLWEQVEGQLV